MQQEPKDLSNYFAGTDIDINITSWKQEDKDYWLIFIPLELNTQPQNCLQKIGDTISVLKFAILEVNQKLHFADLVTNRGWYFDTTEIQKDRFRLVGDGQGVTFLKEPVADLGIFVD